jgi:hypothetical protein
VHRKEGRKISGVNPLRYQELLGRLLEGELTGAEASELSAGLLADPDLRRDLRWHLELWEVWSQHQAPERSAEAFVNSWKTRLRAESEDPDAFAKAVRNRFDARRPPRASMQRLVQTFQTAIRRPAGLAWAVSASVLALAATIWFASPWPAHAIITLEGEAVCTACVLHESQEHAPAIRVLTGTATNLYYLDRSPELTALRDYFCGGPNAATAEGTKRTQKGRLLFRATTVAIPAANQPRETPTNSVRIIFPF